MERKIDGLGRIVIPMEWRKVLGISEGTLLNMELKNGKIELSKTNYCCAICSGSIDVKDVKGVRVCQACIDEIKVGTFQEAV